MLIKNFKELALSEERREILEILDYGLEKALPFNFLEENFRVEGSRVLIKEESFDLRVFKNIYILGFGKGSALISKIIGEKLKEFLKEGYVIDVDIKDIYDKELKLQFTAGTHPLPSTQNLEFTEKIIQRLSNLSENDLVFTIVCGGGSAMFIKPEKISLEKYIEINQELLKSGANIYEMNIIRKHLDLVKGGGLAKVLYPAQVISLIFSDVPGNDLSFIASGPTVKDETKIDDAIRIIEKFNLNPEIKNYLIETSKEEIYFEKIKNILMMTNRSILEIMKNKTEELGIKANIVSDDLKGEVSEVAKYLIEKITKSEEKLLLFGGETTVKVKGNGKGGRNQELVLWFLKYLKDFDNKKTLIVSFNSDGWDNSEFGGAIGDWLSLEKAKDLNIDEFLNNNDSFHFFKKIGDGILTGRLFLNFADLILVMRT